mgnify:CR=1 FL=1|jgi:V-type H+-transporting ATPase subunit d
MGNAWDGHGGMTTFNVTDGFEEAWIRGYRSGFITHAAYQQLMDYKPPSDGQNSLNDIKLNLQETDYGTFLGDYTNNLDEKVLARKMQEKVASEFHYLRCLASPDLAKFLDFIAVQYMIENVVSILNQNSSKNMEEVIEELHPLGRFDDSALRSLVNMETSKEGIEEIYSLVLVDTPLAPYFARLVEVLGGKGNLTDILRDTSSNVVTNLLQRFYLEDFYAFCQSLGGETAEVMGDILEQRADHRSIKIVKNTIGTVLAKPNNFRDRAMLFPSFGKLYPMLLEEHDVTTARRIGFVPIDSLPMLKHSLSCFPEFKSLANSEIMDGRGDLEHYCYEREVKLCELAFEGQFHYGMFYAYFRLREQEIRNVEYIARMTLLRTPEEMKDNVIPIFYDEQPWRTGAEANLARR